MTIPDIKNRSITRSEYRAIERHQRVMDAASGGVSFREECKKFRRWTRDNQLDPLEFQGRHYQFLRTAKITGRHRTDLITWLYAMFQYLTKFSRNRRLP